MDIGVCVASFTRQEEGHVTYSLFVSASGQEPRELTKRYRDFVALNDALGTDRYCVAAAQAGELCLPRRNRPLTSKVAYLFTRRTPDGAYL